MSEENWGVWMGKNLFSEKEEMCARIDGKDRPI
jgi:hypothetical protein